MKRLKIKIFIRRHRWLFTLAIITVLFGGSTLLLRNVDISSIASDPTIFGALGTLVGAFIGGFSHWLDQSGPLDGSKKQSRM